VFSCGDSPCKSGARALDLYANEAPGAFVAWPENGTIPMYRCAGGKPPDLSALETDICIFPPDLSWTMAFTHELSMHLGPYFSRKEWQR
jgi:hypothetical protein